MKNQVGWFWFICSDSHSHKQRAHETKVIEALGPDSCPSVDLEQKKKEIYEVILYYMDGYIKKYTDAAFQPNPNELHAAMTFIAKTASQLKSVLSNIESSASDSVHRVKNGILLTMSSCPAFVEQDLVAFQGKASIIARYCLMIFARQLYNGDLGVGVGTIGGHYARDLRAMHKSFIDSLGLSMLEGERRYIEATVQACHGHVGKAAERLGLSRKTLYNKRTRWG